MAVYREEEPGTVVGHLPREISRTLALALKNAASQGLDCPNLEASGRSP